MRFERIEERLAQSDGHLVAGTLNDPAYGIQLPERAVNQLVPERRGTLGAQFLPRLAIQPLAGNTAQLGDPGPDFDRADHLLGHDSGRHQRQRQPPRKMAAAPQIVEGTVFPFRHEIGMARTGRRAKVRIVARTGIAVAKYDRERSTRSVPVADAAYDLRQIALLTGRASLRTAAATVEIREEILARKRHARRHAVEHHADQRTVRLPENRESEFCSV